MAKLIVSLLVVSLIAVSAVDMGVSLRARLADRSKVMERALERFRAEKSDLELSQVTNALNGAGGGNFLNSLYRLFFPQVSCSNGQAATADTTGGDRVFAPAGPGTPKMLNNGQQLISSLGMYTLIMQSDCNLVLYYANGKPNQAAIWATGTQGQGTGCTANIDSTGIMTVVTGSGTTAWSSAHSGSSANAASGSNQAWVSANSMQGQTAVYIVQDDGNFVAYQCSSPYWATMTQGRTYLELVDTMKNKWDINAIPLNVLEGIKRKCFGDDTTACLVGARIPMGYIPREKLNFFDE